MPAPWDETRLTQAAAVAAEHGCASAVDVESLVEHVRQLRVDEHILVVAGDTLARHLQWIIEEPDSGLVPEVLAAIREAATRDLAWWENCVKQAGFKSPAAQALERRPAPPATTTTGED